MLFEQSSPPIPSLNQDYQTEDDYMPGMVEPSTPDIINEMDALFSNLIKDTTSIEKVINRLNVYFLSRPTLIDPHLPKWLSPLIPLVMNGYPQIAKVVYTIAKIRGYKFISMYLPHEASLMIITNYNLFKLLSSPPVSGDIGNSEDKCISDSDDDNWHLKYVYLLIATSTLLAPFSLEKFKYSYIDPPSLVFLLEKISNILLDTFLGEKDGSIDGPLQKASIAYCTAIFKRKEFFPLKNLFLSSLLNSHSIGKYQLFLKLYDHSLKNIGLSLINNISISLEIDKSLSLQLVYLSLLEKCASNFSVLQEMALVKTGESRYQWKATKSLIRTLNSSNTPLFIKYLFDELELLLPNQMPGISLKCNAHLLALYHCTLIKGVEGFDVSNLGIFNSLLNWEGERGHRSVVVRDTSLLLLWSLIRLPFKMVLPKTCIRSLMVSLLSTLLFDREVSIRRGAVACLQEFLGRWMYDGIEKEEMMSFICPFSISGRLDDPSSRINQLVSLVSHLSFKDDILESIIRNRIRLGSWDRRHREAMAIGVFSILNWGSNLLFSVLKEGKQIEPSYKHGLILALSSSNILENHHEILEYVFKEMLENVSERSLHFDMLSFSLIKVLINLNPLDSRMLDCAWKVISFSKDTRMHSLVADSLLKNLSPETEGIESFYREKILPTAHKGRSIHARLASILSLGSMPPFLLKKRSDSLQNLFSSILSSPSIEVRKNMIIAIGRMKSFICSSLLIDIIIESSKSYECDSRGDIGSELRGVSMTLLKDLNCSCWYSIALRHLFDKLDRLRVLALDIIFDSCPPIFLSESIYEPQKFFNASKYLLGNGEDDIALSGLISSSGSMNILISIHAYSSLKEFSILRIINGIKNFLSCLKGKDAIIVGRRTIILLIERIFGFVDDFEAFPPNANDIYEFIGSLLIDWSSMSKIPIQDLLRICRIMKYLRSFSIDVDEWCSGWESARSEAAYDNDSSQKVIYEMFKKD